MKKLCSIFFLLISTQLMAEVKSEFSGNVEVQARHSVNNDEAKDAPLLQEWNQEQFYLAYGNINGKFDLGNSRIETNVFGRYSQSNLYQDQTPSPNYIAPQIFSFPNRLVAREVAKLSQQDEGDNYRSEMILNKMYYEWSYEEHRFMFGRIYINYGGGEIFNPINPFNQPTGLTSISQVAQGNDGLNFTFYKNDNHTINFYFLGDKSLQGYEGQIDKTLWAHGEFQFSEKLQLDYVIGEDQRRHKVGGQARYSLSESMIFLQTLYQTAYTDDLNEVESHHLWDIMLGFDQQITNRWHLRAEGGHQKKNKYASLTTINDRFLPTEYFIAIANQYEIHPLVKLGGTIINDVKTGFTYFITRNTYSFAKSSEVEIFAYLPMAKGSDIENQAQKLVTTDVGLALRTFF
jgi:hypothetical protein